MRYYRHILVFMIVFVFGTAVIHSLVTEFDDSFGTNGLVTTPGYFNANEMALQNDGKIVVATTEGTLLRYLPDGTLDNSFGAAGVAIMVITDDWRNGRYVSNLTITDVTVLSSGKILVVGYTTTGDFDWNTPDIIAIRFLSNGDVDTTFGFEGLARININYTDSASAVVERPNGKLIVVGYSSAPPPSNLSPVVLQLTENGTLDDTFGTNGATQPLIGANGSSHGVVLQNNNKIVATGTTIISGKPNGLVIRYTENGLIDTTFSGDGYALLDIGSANTVGWHSAVNSTGDLLVSGRFNNGSDDDFYLAKFDDGGNLDMSFGTNGVATSDFGAVGFLPGGMALDQLGRAVVTGESDSHIFVARYSLSGVLDSSFETNGFLAIPIGSGSRGADLLIQPVDNKIVVLGNSSSSNLAVLARLKEENISKVYLPLVVR